MSPDDVSNGDEEGTPTLTDDGRRMGNDGVRTGARTAETNLSPAGPCRCPLHHSSGKQVRDFFIHELHR